MVRIRIRNLLFFGAVVLAILVHVGAAAEVSVNQTATDLAPGVNQTLATVTVHAAGNETRIQDTTHNFPFPVWLTNRTRTVTETPANNSTSSNTTITGDLIAHPPTDFEPGERTNTYHLILPAESTGLELTYRVQEVRNLTVTPRNLTGNISVGSTGLFGAVTVSQQGNADQDITTNLTGNLSDYLRIDPQFSVHPDTPHTARLTYQVPRDTPFGNYTGQLVLSSDDNETRVNLSASFYDELSPAIQEVSIPPTVMATTAPSWDVTARDNLGIDHLVGNVSRTVTVTRNNTTVQENTSVATVDFTHKDHTDQWNTSFTATEDRGQYYVNLTATDTAGNTASTVRAFQIERLEALTVEETNFEFESVRPTEMMTREIFELDTETPVTVTLSSFTELQTNGTIVPGIRKTGEASAETLDATGDGVTVSAPGTYELVMEAETKGRFRGQLNYSTVPQHVPVPDTTFSGQFIDPECPEEETFPQGNYTYDFGYTNGGCVGGRAELVISLPGEQCQGYRDAETCINVRGLDFGRMDALADAVYRWKLIAAGAFVLMFITIFIAAGGWLFDRRIWPYLDFELAKEAD